MTILHEYLRFLRTRKKLWMAPIFVLLLALSALATLGSALPLLPFIYALF